MMEKVPREITQNVQMQDLWFLCSACMIMLIVINIKFREDSLNHFQVIELTRFLQTDRRPGQKNNT